MLWFAGVFSVILIVIGIAVLFTTRAALYDQINSDVSNRAARLQETLTQSAPGDNTRPLIQRIQNSQQVQLAARLLTAGGYQAAIMNPDVTFATVNYEETQAPDFTGIDEKAGGGITTIDTKTTSGEDFRYYVSPLSANSYILVGRSIEPEKEALRRLLFVLIGGGAVGMVLSGFGGYVLAGRALKPIKNAMDSQRTFVADASHELRTPLSLIRANAEILKREAQKAENADEESLDDIIKEADHLSYLVGQMLTLARADVNKTPFEMEPVEWSHLTGDVVRQAKVLADQKQITLNFENDGGVIVAGDEQRLRELALILIDNAVKYTDEGGNVAVSVAKNGSRAKLAVTDSGHGIPATDIPRIFDRFYRVDKARSREMGGTGLGLAIARWIAEAHGGTIALASEVGKGTTVTVELPAV